MFRLIRRAIPMRGPKKAKGAEEIAGDTTTDVINIFKDKKDPEIKHMSEYPAWLADVLKGDEHPVKILNRMYKGEQVEMTGRDQNRLRKWAHKKYIVYKNLSKPIKMRYFPSLHQRRVDLGYFYGENSDDEPDDHLGAHLNIALGEDYKKEIESQMQRLKVNIESHKK